MEKQAEYKTYTQSIPQTDRMDYLSPMSQQPRAVPGGREAARHRGAAARAGDPRAAHRADAHQRALRVARHARARHRRDDGVLVLLPRAREGALDLRQVSRRAHDRALLPRRRAVDGHPRRASSTAARSSWTRCRRTSTSTRRCSRRTRSGWRAPRAWRRSRRKDAIALGATGPMLRGSGVTWDLRKAEPYCGYEQLRLRGAGRAPRATPTTATRCACRRSASPRASPSRRSSADARAGRARRLPAARLQVRAAAQGGGEDARWRR